jgi:hypothetical protein
MPNLKSVVDQLKKERDAAQRQLSALNAALRAFAGVYRNGTGKAARTMSAAGRARIAAAQRARWAKVKANAKGEAVKPGAKRVMSAASRRKIAAAQRARWAKVKEKS